jgi:dTMP kinase
VSIALVGVDGSGKSTQARALARRLTAAGVPARYFENAGGRPLWNRLARAVGRAHGGAGPVDLVPGRDHDGPR